jgi:starch synthase (maltosyl-transferring)
MPERDDAGQAGSTASAFPASSEPPDTSPGGAPAVTISKPSLGAIFDRIPVHKVSPVIEGGAYPAKAVVGEAIPIRATVFREGHDAVNASVVLTDPSGTNRMEPMHRTTPQGFDWWTASVVLETEGLWTFRVEGWSDPWETWVHTAEIKIPAGIDVSLVCTEGIGRPARGCTGRGRTNGNEALRSSSAGLADT